MTTAWAWLTRGEISRAVSANWGGFFTGILALVIAPWAVVSGLQGNWTVVRPHETTVILIAVMIALVTFVHWVSRTLLSGWL